MPVGKTGAYPLSVESRRYNTGLTTRLQHDKVRWLGLNHEIVKSTSSAARRFDCNVRCLSGNRKHDRHKYSIFPGQFCELELAALKWDDRYAVGKPPWEKKDKLTSTICIE